MMRYNILLAVLILFMLPLYGFAQREWKRVFFDEHDAPPTFQPPIEFYDKGYLVGVSILIMEHLIKAQLLKPISMAMNFGPKFLKIRIQVLYFRPD
jgi:hypothetical protein